MRVAAWESSTGALVTFLNSTVQAYMADLFTFTLASGAVIRYTSADVPVAINGNTFATGPVIRRSKTKLAVGISVDTLDLTINADASVTYSGVPLLQFIASGGLDSARMTLERAFSAAPGAAWVGTLALFQGRVSDTTTSRYEAALSVNSDSELLNVMIPRNLYQTGCGNTLFDAGCGLSRAAYGTAATATSTTDAARTTFSTTLGQADGYFALGFAVCTSGLNAGSSRTIKAYGSGAVVTIQPWPSAVAAGDTFTVYPGCNKAQATCGGKFGNLAKFRGYPYIPAPETIT